MDAARLVAAGVASAAAGSAWAPARLRERPRRADSAPSGAAGSAAGWASTGSPTWPSPAAWLGVDPPVRRERRAGGGPPGNDAVVVVSTVVTWNCGVGASSGAGVGGALGADGVLAGGAPPGNEAAPRGRPGETGRSGFSSAGSAGLSGDVGVPEGSRSGSDRDWSWEAMVLLTKLGRPPTGAAESRCALGERSLPPAQAEEA
jgi:hypothetical protein